EVCLNSHASVSNSPRRLLSDSLSALSACLASASLRADKACNCWSGGALICSKVRARSAVRRSITSMVLILFRNCRTLVTSSQIPYRDGPALPAAVAMDEVPVDPDPGAAAAPGADRAVEVGRLAAMASIC